MSTIPLFADSPGRSSGALFSECMRYRYSLHREWAPQLPTITFLMLNPSTADEIDNDPTVERCERRAVMMGFGRMEVRNIFAWRSTDRSVLKHLPDPVGPENDQYILEAVTRSDMTVCGWGIEGDIANRSRDVRALLRSTGKTIHCLRLTKSGEPGHPLYIGYSQAPIPWTL